ncbi:MULTISPECIES: peptide chain release factor 1 [unclassified Coleofasciculus]|uniref:peptide chain release factor 1 n=1 Tax=unclassified Coleofasciculus TaxID=2692782 RepID=UPI0018814D10|nr:MULTISPECIES: peptide chain release factor 1 [unclassified Coleofasciculus]MBE9127660.1 peptide chain release factor 1 [Coleofasciculus sp. LEGE 07081]MBE9150998.1 peptide chain release factor 1 [Coleofasciculus sp. LEGE 07092]
MYRLKYLPWRSLLQVAGLTIAIAIFLEILLWWGFVQSAAGKRMLAFLLSPPLGMIMILAAAVGVGVLAVYLLERFYKSVFINSGSLWALVPCLALAVFLKSLLPLPNLLVNLSYPQLIGIVVGVFWKGRPHWR